MPVSYKETQKHKPLSNYFKEKVINNAKEVWDLITKWTKGK